MMTEQTNRNYYAIIPANVRYDKTLTANAKLLYGEITALANDKGYCWASNGYFAELYEVSKETISRWISILEKNGYVNTQIIYRDNSKEILERRIYIIGIPQVVSEKTFVKNDDIINTPIDENNKTYQQNHQEPTNKIINTPIDENVKENNTLFNNTFNNTNNKKEKERACVRADKSINKINNNISKDKKTDFDNLINSYTDNDELKEAIYEFIKMRTAIKKPMTTKALEILLNKLNTLASDDDTKIKVLEQSIEHCWQTVYALKEKEDGKDIRDSGQFGHRLTNEVERAKGYATPKETASKYDIKIKPVTITDTDYSKII